MPAVQLDRRRFLGFAAGAAAVASATTLTNSSPAWSAPRFPDDPFTLGVASGEPRPDGVVVWTRLAPAPLSPDGLGGLPERALQVSWQVAEDPHFRRVVRAGSERTGPAIGFSVHAEVRGLRPDREYWYRFRCGRELSPVGRTRTAPSSGTRLDSLAFAFASCQQYSGGLFTPQQHLAEEDLDFVLFLGDYIYEGPGADKFGLGRAHTPAIKVQSLADYRVRHAQYKTDPGLQAAHAAHPWIITLDDHEVENNFWGTDPDPAAVQLRVNGYRAWWENTPVAAAMGPLGAESQIFRRFTYGDLATLHVLDTRSYRDRPAQACTIDEKGPQSYCPEQLDPSRTLLGETQERWLHDGLAAAATHWNILGNQGFFTQRDRDFAPDNREFNREMWDGYVVERQALLDHIRSEGVDNLIVATGDSHQNWVLETPSTYLDWTGKDPVATEFMVTSLTASGPRPFKQVFDPEPDTPHLRYRDNSHGYARVTLTPDEWRTDYRAVDTVESWKSRISTLTSWVVESGRPGVVQA